MVSFLFVSDINCDKHEYDVTKNVFGFGNFQVYAQTSVLVKKSNRAEGEPSSLKWTWRPELIESTAVLGKGDVSANRIFDQKDMANDASDYLWYMTR